MKYLNKALFILKTAVMFLFQIPKNWILHFANFFYQKGYIALFTFIPIYLGFFTVFDGRHERSLEKASFERNIFLTTINNGRPEFFVPEIRKLAVLQNIPTTSEPDLFQPTHWGDKEYPNKPALASWARLHMPNCKNEHCNDGSLDKMSDGKKYRILLKSAPFSNVDLSQVDLSKTFVFSSDFETANFKGTNFNESYFLFSKLVGTNFQQARFNKSNFTGVNAENADFRFSYITDSNLSGNFKGANFSLSVLKNTKLKFKIYEALFVGADLRGADLSNSTYETILNKDQSGKVVSYRMLDPVTMAVYSKSTKFPTNIEFDKNCMIFVDDKKSYNPKKDFEKFAQQLVTNNCEKFINISAQPEFIKK